MEKTKIELKIESGEALKTIPQSGLATGLSFSLAPGTPTGDVASVKRVFKETAAVKKSRYALLMNPWDLSSIQMHNAPLYRAYLLKESLDAVIDASSPDDARQELERWLSWASRSKLTPSSSNQTSD